MPHNASQCRTLPAWAGAALAGPVLGPHKDDECKRQIEAEPQTMSVHREQRMDTVGRLNIVTSAQSVDLALGGAEDCFLYLSEPYGC